MSINMGMDGKLVAKFRNNKTGQDILVDMTDEVMGHVRFELATSIVRELGIEAAYKALRSSNHRFASLDLDYDRGIVIAPEDYAGITFSEYKQRFEFAALDDDERERRIESAVSEFSKLLDDDLFLSEIETSEKVDLRGCIELYDAVFQKMDVLMDVAYKYRLSHGYVDTSELEDEYNLICSEYSRHLLEALGAITLTSLNQCDDNLRHTITKFERAMDKVLSRIPEDISQMPPLEDASEELAHQDIFVTPDCLEGLVDWAFVGSS